MVVRPNRESGMSMIEVLIALVLLAGGLFTVASLQTQLIKNSADTANRTHALLLAQEASDRMRVNSSAITDYKSAFASFDSCANYSYTPCGSYVGSSGRKDFSGSCSATQMAVFDVWEMMCGTENSDGIASQADLLTAPQVAISCSTTNCSPTENPDIKIEVSWVSNVVKTLKDNDSISGDDGSERRSIELVVRL